MHLLEKIQDCQSMDELDGLRHEISIAGIYGEIEDYPFLKSTFLSKKEQLGKQHLPARKKGAKKNEKK